MATITLKNVPENVHAALKEQARRHKRSLNQEAIFCLDLALGRGSRDPQTLLEGIRGLRSRISVKRVDLDWIDAAEAAGASMIVADTSLIASLLLSTPATSVAEAVLEKDTDWTAPVLWRYEFKNVLATQVRVLGLPLEDAIALFEKAEELIVEPEIEVEPRAILGVASAKMLSAYDAEFVALAMALKVKLVTADGGILKAAPEFAVAFRAFVTG